MFRILPSKFIQARFVYKFNQKVPVYRISAVYLSTTCKHCTLPIETKHNVSREWKEIEAPTIPSLIKHWMNLSKFRLTSLVVLTTLAGYVMGSPALDPLVLSATLLGTGLTSSSAASLNQFLEIPFDSQMKRTQNRPLVVGQLSPLHAVTFSALTGTAGLTLLSMAVNPLTAFLGASNLILYTCIYTPMKRANIVNTWIGSVVGAIPPIMGYTAATGMIGNLSTFQNLFNNILLYFS